jgi:ABC-2 type transport system permease protein
MRLLGIAIATEARKAASARVLRWTTSLVLVALAALILGILVAIGAGDPLVIAKLGPFAELEGWAALVGVAAQITSAGLLAAFGIGLSWLVGREFAEGTVSGLFALAVPRWAIALAKLIVFVAWAIVLAVAVCFTVLIVGLAVGLGMPDAEAWRSLGRIGAVTVLIALIAFPVAWASTLGRGLLPGIATAIGILVVAQVSAFSGTGAWIPIVAPALWAISPGSVTPGQLSLVATVPLAFGALTLVAWHRLELDR